MIQLLAAMDGLRALAAILEIDPPLLWAHHVQVRSVLIASARAHWLLDPGVETRERVARGFEERRNLLWEQERLPYSPGHLDSQYRELARQARAWELQPRWKKGRLSKIEGADLIGDGDAVTALLEELDRLGDLETDLGGMPTGQLVHLLGSAFVHSDAVRLLEAVEAEDDEVSLVDGRPSMRFVGLLVGAGLLGFEAAFRRFVEVMGWGDAWGRWEREAHRRVYLLNGLAFGTRRLGVHGLMEGA